MSDYTPDHWSIIKIDTAEHGTVFKVFATWSGSYLYGESWKLNSGIEKIVGKGDSWDVYGYSGSVYTLRKGREGMSGYGASVFSRLKAQIEASGGIVELVGLSQLSCSRINSLVVKIQQQKMKKILDK